MSKTKSKPEKKSASKGSASKTTKKKPDRDAPLFKDQGKVFEEGIAAAAPPSRTATEGVTKGRTKGTKKAHSVEFKVAEAPSATTTPPTPAPPDDQSVAAPAALAPEFAPGDGATANAAPAEKGSTPMTSPPRAADAPTDDAPSAAPVTPVTDEPRLPPLGTVLRKLDRHGTLRCEATIVDGGIRYKDTVYRSLSAAAIAAARDQGKTTKTVNGWAWWGLTKPVRASASPLGALDRAFERYHEQVTKRLDGASAEARTAVLAALQRHARVLQNLHDEDAAKQETRPCSACGGQGEVTVEGERRPCATCGGRGEAA